MSNDLRDQLETYDQNIRKQEADEDQAYQAKITNQQRNTPLATPEIPKVPEISKIPGCPGSVILPRPNQKKLRRVATRLQKRILALQSTMHRQITTSPRSRILNRPKEPRIFKANMSGMRIRFTANQVARHFGRRLPNRKV